MRYDDDDGATAVEYSLLAAAIAAVVVVIAIALGGQVSGLFSGTCEAVATEAAPATTC